MIPPLPGIEVAPDLKDQIRSELLSLGVRSDDLPLILDLATHAAGEALQAGIRVSNTAPHHLQLTVLLVTYSLLQVATAPPDG